jgi:hypothetical protein
MLQDPQSFQDPPHSRFHADKIQLLAMRLNHAKHIFNG